MPKQLADKIRASGHLEGERRQVTVVFADLSGFTALAERIGEKPIVFIVAEEPVGRPGLTGVGLRTAQPRPTNNERAMSLGDMAGSALCRVVKQAPAFRCRC